MRMIFFCWIWQWLFMRVHIHRHENGESGRVECRKTYLFLQIWMDGWNIQITNERRWIDEILLRKRLTGWEGDK